MDFAASDVSQWKHYLESYPTRIQSVNKPDLVSLDDFYRKDLPGAIKGRSPTPHMTGEELTRLMRWKLRRGKWRPRLLEYVSSLSDCEVRAASEKAFASIPDLSKAVSELTVLKGVGPATASAILAAFAPDVAPFMSDEAMEAAIGSSKDYLLKCYLVFADKLQAKAKVRVHDPSSIIALQELSTSGYTFTPSDVELALWSSAMETKLLKSQLDSESMANTSRATKRKRRH